MTGCQLTRKQLARVERAIARLGLVYYPRWRGRQYPRLSKD